jgi:hypothetical protein
MAIISNNPIIIPEIVYNIWWITRLEVDAPNPNVSVNATVTFQLMSVDQYGNAQFMPNQTPVVVTLNNILNASLDVAAILNAAIDALGQLAQTQGAIN